MRRQAALLTPDGGQGRAATPPAAAAAAAAARHKAAAAVSFNRSDSIVSGSLVSVRGGGWRMATTTTTATTTAATTATSSTAAQSRQRQYGGSRSGALAMAAAASSGISAALFLAAVITSSWDNVAFDFAAVNASSRETLSLLTPSGGTAGLVLLPTTLGNRSLKSACLLNMRGGLWSVCNLVDPMNPQNRAHFSAHCQASSPMRNASCFSYIADGGALRAGPGQPAAERSQPESQIMKMQNNTISCCIVVMLCILASVVTGAIGVGARVVPSITVTGVLYLTAGIFASFGNSIELEKIARMSRKPRTCAECSCYSLVKTPEEYCNAAYRSVTAGWSLIPSWSSAVSFLVASIFWLCLSRSVRIEKSKSML